MHDNEKDQRFIWRPYTQAKNSHPPIAVERALGAYIYTSSGQKLFDGISSWWVNAHGHCHPHIAEAISAQAARLEQVIFADFTHEPAIKLAKMLIDIVPPGLSRVFYSDNGSTAVEVALKMAYQYWHNRGEHRPHFIALEHGYHGDTFGAMAASERSVFTRPFWPLLFDVLKTPSTCRSDASNGHTEADISTIALAQLRTLLKKHEGHVAGLIFEPMLQAAGGMRIFTKGFLRGIRQLCDEFGILLIADEIATGFYRTGRLFACEHEQAIPDIMCIAKGFTGGFLPLSATIATEAIYEAFLGDSKAQALLHGHSFAANPLGCAAAIASLELFAQDECKALVKGIVDALSESIDEFQSLPNVKNARNLGTVLAIELWGEAGYLSTAAQAAAALCLQEGLYLRPLGNILYLMPPLCVNPEEIHWALALMKKAIKLSASGT